MLSGKNRRQLAGRLNRLRGQIEGIKKMVEEPRYCIDILTQIAAVKSALNAAAKTILEDHLKTCIKKAMKKSGGDKEIRELLNIVGKF